MVHYKHLGTDRAIGMDTLHTQDNMPETAMSSIRSSAIDKFKPAGQTVKIDERSECTVSSLCATIWRGNVKCL